MEPNQDRRRGHFHRARRGHERRGGPDRRTQTQTAAPAPPPRDQVNVEQIMREIRTRVAARHGIELTYEQIQDLAARRLESILDPRAIKPSLLEGLRRGTDASTSSPGPKESSEPAYTFEDTTIYDSHRAVLRWIRKLLNPLLKLFFNPNPLIRAMHLQAGINTEAAKRDAERERQQAEWNALHYEVLQRLVTEISRLSLELQALTTRVEALDARVDFADRRVRTVEAAQSHARPAPRDPVPPPAPASEAGAVSGEASEGGPLDGARRRRRRRRGRRSGAPVMDGTQPFRQPGTEAEESPADAIEPADMDEPADEVTEQFAAHDESDADLPAAELTVAEPSIDVAPPAPVHEPVPEPEAHAAPEPPAPAADLPPASHEQDVRRQDQ